MTSRAVLLLGFFLLSCLILLGTAVVHLALGSEGGPPLPHGRKDSPLGAAGASPGAAASAGDVLHPAAADTLALLLHRIRSTAAADSSIITDATIPFFAEMIAVLDRASGVRFVITVAEPDEGRAAARAEALRNALLLNVREPEMLDIVVAEGHSSASVRAAPYRLRSE